MLCTRCVGWWCDVLLASAACSFSQTCFAPHQPLFVATGHGCLPAQELVAGVAQIGGSSVEHNKFCVSVHFRNCHPDDYPAGAQQAAEPPGMHVCGCQTADAAQWLLVTSLMALRPMQSWALWRLLLPHTLSCVSRVAGRCSKYDHRCGLHQVVGEGSQPATGCCTKFCFAARGWSSRRCLIVVSHPTLPACARWIGTRALHWHTCWSCWG